VAPDSRSRSSDPARRLQFLLAGAARRDPARSRGDGASRQAPGQARGHGSSRLDTVVTEPNGEHVKFDSMLRSLYMAYQPIIRTDGTLFAYEALVRSEEPGMSGAGDILDAAERLQRLTDLGRTVRSKAGRFHAANADWCCS
jgi:EAL domain-containing protein (putative c-di-GMP-specific phosphodiesterase class I)